MLKISHHQMSQTFCSLKNNNSQTKTSKNYSENKTSYASSSIHNSGHNELYQVKTGTKHAPLAWFRPQRAWTSPTELNHLVQISLKWFRQFGYPFCLNNWGQEAKKASCAFSGSSLFLYKNVQGKSKIGFKPKSR